MELFPTSEQRQKSKKQAASLQEQGLKQLGWKYISCENDSHVGKPLDELHLIDAFIIEKTLGLIPFAIKVRRDTNERYAEIRLARSTATKTELTKLRQFIGTVAEHPKFFLFLFFQGTTLVEAARLSSEDFLHAIDNCPDSAKIKRRLPEGTGWADILMISLDWIEQQDYSSFERRKRNA